MLSNDIYREKIVPSIRPNLFLNIPPLQPTSSAETKQKTPTQEFLNLNFDSLKAQIKNISSFHFRETPLIQDYSAMRQNGFSSVHNGFMQNNSGLDAFMHASRQQGKCAGVFDGDKFHVSVKDVDVPRTFNALSSLLFSEDCPFDKWKVTDMERAEPNARVSNGAQFTLYVKPDTADSRYTASTLKNIRDSLELLESVISEHNIQPGQHPDSDVRPSHWQFTSYRNELRSDREGSYAQSIALRKEPFFRLVTE